MLITDIYRKYPITPMLAQHMIRAAAVGAYIVDHWQGKTLNRNAIITMLLMHDTGNIIKFDLDNFPQLLGDELGRIDFWRQQQKEFIQKYGTDEHEATKQIAKEVGITGEALELLMHMGSRHIQEMAEGSSIASKICMYADLRSGPFGILSVNKRFDDILTRYKGRNHELSDIARTEEKRTWCLAIEQQLQENVNTPLDTISDTTILPYIESLTKYDVFVD